MVDASFISGLIAGLRLPITARRPSRIETRVNPVVLKSSYRPAREDYDNIKKDFEKVIPPASEKTKHTEKAQL